MTPTYAAAPTREDLKATIDRQAIEIQELKLALHRARIELDLATGKAPKTPSYEQPK